MVDEDRFVGMLAEVRPHLDELQWRLLLGAQAPMPGGLGTRFAAVFSLCPRCVPILAAGRSVQTGQVSR